MKELRLWIPDTKRPGFTKEMKRQLALVEKTSEDQDTLAFIEHASIMDMKKAMLAVMQECLLPELAEIKSGKSNNAWQPRIHGFPGQVMPPDTRNQYQDVKARCPGSRLCPFMSS